MKPPTSIVGQLPILRFSGVIRQETGSSGRDIEAGRIVAVASDLALVKAENEMEADIVLPEIAKKEWLMAENGRKTQVGAMFLPTFSSVSELTAARSMMMGC